MHDSMHHITDTKFYIFLSDSMHHITDTKFYFFLSNLDVFSNIFLPHFLYRISNTILNERLESADICLALYLQKKKEEENIQSFTIKYNVAVAYLSIIFIR